MCLQIHIYTHTAVWFQASFTNVKDTWTVLYFVSYETISSDSFFLKVFVSKANYIIYLPNFENPCYMYAVYFSFTIKMDVNRIFKWLSHSAFCIFKARRR